MEELTPIIYDLEDVIGQNQKNFILSLMIQILFLISTKALLF